jgi:hypothetical protein
MSGLVTTLRANLSLSRRRVLGWVPALEADPVAAQLWLDDMLDRGLGADSVRLALAKLNAALARRAAKSQAKADARAAALASLRPSMTTPIVPAAVARRAAWVVARANLAAAYDALAWRRDAAICVWRRDAWRAIPNALAAVSRQFLDAAMAVRAAAILRPRIC